MSDMSQSYAVDDGSDVASHFLYFSSLLLLFRIFGWREYDGDPGLQGGYGGGRVLDNVNIDGVCQQVSCRRTAHR